MDQNNLNKYKIISKQQQKQFTASKSVIKTIGTFKKDKEEYV